MRPRRPLALPLAAVVLTPAIACADAVSLKGGGRITGEIVRDDSTSRREVAVETRWGRIVLDRGRVERTKEESPAEIEYRRRAPTVSDTVEGQHAFALWCRDNGLGPEMRRHLERVLAHDPEHEPSRRTLGYQRIGGRWMNRDQRLAARGLVRYEGDYRTQEEIELLRREAAAQQLTREWSRRFDRIRKDLVGRDPDATRFASDELLSLEDPTAASPLAEWLGEERDPHLKRLLIQAAGRLNHPTTLGVLARIALEDESDEARSTAIEQLSASTAEALATPFVAALAHKDNRIVNRAGAALASLGGPGEIEPLINALVTKHRFKVGNDSGGDTYAFNPGSGSFSFGGGGAKIVTQKLNNPRVLATLVDLTGVNFSFDQPSWRAWLTAQQVAAPIDLRRDP